MNAYNEIYLDDSMKNLGEAFDYAVNICGEDADEFFMLFITSGVAEQYERANPKYVSGMSGTELAINILEKYRNILEYPAIQSDFDCSPEYWAGWSLAYFQWKTGKSYRDISKCFNMVDILKLYSTLHEASEEKFVDTLNANIESRGFISKLQQQRKFYGYSQRELAEKSGVNLRTLQQYEIGTKDISKASVSVVLSMANVLGCEVEDLV